jgi:hypothetical protein
MPTMKINFECRENFLAEHKKFFCRFNKMTFLCCQINIHEHDDDDER